MYATDLAIFCSTNFHTAIRGLSTRSYQRRSTASGEYAVRSDLSTAFVFGEAKQGDHSPLDVFIEAPTGDIDLNFSLEGIRAILRAPDGFYYAYDLARPSTNSPLGVVNLTGAYVIGSTGPSAVGNTTWFQICQNMKFLSHYPDCGTSCPQSCGGSMSCGLTCSGLQHTRTADGVVACRTLSKMKGMDIKFLDPTNPAKGLSVNMSHGDSFGCRSGMARSLTLRIFCRKTGIILPPTEIAELDPGSCAFVSDLYHPAACPMDATTSAEEKTGGHGGVYFLLFILICLFYFGGGCMYRSSVAQAKGWEMLPHHTFWTPILRPIAIILSKVLDKMKNMVGMRKEAPDNTGTAYSTMGQ
eukprot:jgi/Mesvir1/19783/Mv13080-RA.1